MKPTARDPKHAIELARSDLVTKPLNAMQRWLAKIESVQKDNR